MVCQWSLHAQRFGVGMPILSLLLLVFTPNSDWIKLGHPWCLSCPWVCQLQTTRWEGSILAWGCMCGCGVGRRGRRRGRFYLAALVLACNTALVLSLLASFNVSSPPIYSLSSSLIVCCVFQLLPKDLWLSYSINRENKTKEFQLLIKKDVKTSFTDYYSLAISELTLVLYLVSINMCASNGRCNGCIAKYIHPLIHGQAQVTRGSKGNLASKLTLVLCLASINMCASNGRCDGCIAKHIHPLIHGQAQATRGSKGDLASSASHTWIKSKIEKYTSLKFCIRVSVKWDCYFVPAYQISHIISLFSLTKPEIWYQRKFTFFYCPNVQWLCSVVLYWALVVWIDSVSITRNWQSVL